MAFTINWGYAAHAVVGTTITICQAVALADPTPGVMKWCGIIALVAAQIGASFGVWQAAQFAQFRRLSLELASRIQEPTPSSLKVAPKNEPPPVPPSLPPSPPRAA
jgi:hypothetical protein